MPGQNTTNYGVYSHAFFSQTNCLPNTPHSGLYLAENRVLQPSPAFPGHINDEHVNRPRWHLDIPFPTSPIDPPITGLRRRLYSPNSSSPPLVGGYNRQRIAFTVVNDPQRRWLSSAMRYPSSHNRAKLLGTWTRLIPQNDKCKAGEKPSISSHS